MTKQLGKLGFLSALLALLGVLVISAPGVEAQVNAVWTGQYYDNAYLGEPVAFTRQHDAIQFDWGLGAPAESLGSDTFSVRWSTDVYLPAGTYRFYAQADDNISITIDFANSPIIDTFQTDQVGELMTADVVLEGGEHHIQVDYRELTQEAYAFVSFANLADNPSSPNFGVPTSSPLEVGEWRAEYYTNQSLSGIPTITSIPDAPNHDWGAGAPDPAIPADYWSAEWTANVVMEAGIYRFTAYADDGVRVFFDGVLIIDEWGIASGVPYTATREVISGTHTVTVQYFEETGLARLEFDIDRLFYSDPIVAPTTTATVATSRLNFRDAPSVLAGNILLRLNQGETYPVIARSEDGSWVQIHVDGTRGWVTSDYITLNNITLLEIPVVGQAAPPPTAVPTQPPVVAPVTDVTLRATPYTVNIRSGPGTQFRDLANLPSGATAQVIGRNANNTWWQINYNGIVGWVTAEFTELEGAVNITTIPVTS